MKERPILFNSEMVRAIIDGRKTQTRRPVKGKDVLDCLNGIGVWDGPMDEDEFILSKCLFGQVGDHLWLRENFQYVFAGERSANHPNRFSPSERGIYPYGGADHRYAHLEYAATPPEQILWEGGWKPSLHMPRWASRITLEITGVRVERLQDISKKDARAEGAIPITESKNCLDRYRCGFESLWDSLAKPGTTWADNPWVWVIEFKRVEGSFRDRY